MIENKTITIGGRCSHLGKSWLITDVKRSVFTGLVESVDLRYTVIVNPRKRYLDEAITKRNVSVSQLTGV